MDKYVVIASYGASIYAPASHTPPWSWSPPLPLLDLWWLWVGVLLQEPIMGNLRAIQEHKYYGLKQGQITDMRRVQEALIYS